MKLTLLATLATTALTAVPAFAVEKAEVLDTYAFDIYGNGYDVVELKDEIKRVDYPHVDWTTVAVKS